MTTRSPINSISHVVMGSIAVCMALVLALVLVLGALPDPAPLPTSAGVAAFPAPPSPYPYPFNGDAAHDECVAYNMLTVSGSRADYKEMANTVCEATRKLTGSYPTPPPDPLSLWHKK